MAAFRINTVFRLESRCVGKLNDLGAQDARYLCYFSIKGNYIMRISKLLASLAFVTVAIPSVSAAPQETAASKHEHATATEQTGTMHVMVERARKKQKHLLNES